MSILNFISFNSTSASEAKDLSPTNISAPSGFIATAYLLGAIGGASGSFLILSSYTTPSGPVWKNLELLLADPSPTSVKLSNKPFIRSLVSELILLSSIFLILDRRSSIPLPTAESKVLQNSFVGGIFSNEEICPLIHIYSTFLYFTWSLTW